MENINKIEIRGKVRKLELKIINSKTLAQMTVETDYLYSSGGEPRKEATFHMVEAWENTQVKDLTKIQVGSWVRVIGRYRLKNYKNDKGDEVYFMEIYADYLKKLPETTVESMNKAEINGIVTKVDLKIVNNKTLGNLKVATNYVYNSKGKNTVETTYHNIEAWTSPKVKDLAKLSIGCTVKVSGRYRRKPWEDENGNKKSRYEIYAEELKKVADN